MHGNAPYQQVLTHGFVVDAEGERCRNRSQRGFPIKVMNTLGADVMRLWVAAADYRGEMSVSDEILKRVADAYRRIRNTTRFLLGNLDSFSPDQGARTRRVVTPGSLGCRPGGTVAGTG